MSRLFDGIDDLMTYPVGAGSALNDALSLLMVLKINTASDNTWLSFMEFEVGGVIRAAMGRQPAGSIGGIYFANSNGVIANDAQITDADAWMIVAVTRSTAAVTDVHKLPIGGARTTTSLGALADGTSVASATLKIGGDDDPAAMYMAAFAYWNAVTLTTGQLDGILSAKTTQSILDLSPTACYDDSDSFATDLVGSQDRSAIVGTTDSADDPAGWVYFAAAAPPVYPTLYDYSKFPKAKLARAR